MKYHLSTIINGFILRQDVSFKRDIKKVIDDWKLIYGDRFTYLDIFPKPKKEYEVRQVEVVKIQRPPAVYDNVNYLEKYGT